MESYSSSIEGVFAFEVFAFGLRRRTCGRGHLAKLGRVHDPRRVGVARLHLAPGEQGRGTHGGRRAPRRSQRLLGMEGRGRLPGSAASRIEGVARDSTSRRKVVEEGVFAVNEGAFASETGGG